MSAPHLPPKSCHLETHRRVQTLPMFLGVIVLSVIAGGSAAMIAAGWLVPAYLYDTSIHIWNRTNKEAIKNEIIDSTLLRQIEQRSVTVLDTRKAIGTNIYSDTAAVGTISFLSSDGWGVMYAASYQPGQQQFWQVVDDQGGIRRIEKVVYDKETQLVYIKINGNGFQVFSFLEWQHIEPDMPVWVMDQGRWQKKQIDYPRVQFSQTPHLPHVDALAYSLIPEQTGSGVVLTEQGQLVGFISKNGSLIPGYHIMSELPYILTEGTVKNKALPILGSFVSRHISATGAEPLSGFYISVVQSVLAKKIIQIGDVIIRVNGQTVTPQNLSELLVMSVDDVVLDIWRKGVVIPNIMVKKELMPL